MSKRLQGLSTEQAQALVDELEQVATRVADITYTIGSAWGADWCDRGLKLHRAVRRLQMQIGDKLEVRPTMSRYLEMLAERLETNKLAGG